MAGESGLTVVDASVAVKWFVAEGEDDLREAADLLQSHGQGSTSLVGPALLAHELVNALGRRSREVRDLPAATGVFFDFAIPLYPTDRELMVSTARLSADLGLSTADATYAALALMLDCELVTADHGLADALEGTVRVRTL